MKPKKYIVTRDGKSLRSMKQILMWDLSFQDHGKKDQYGNWGVLIDEQFDVYPYPLVLRAPWDDTNDTMAVVRQTIGFVPQPGSWYLIEEHKTFVYATKLRKVRPNSGY